MATKGSAMQSMTSMAPMTGMHSMTSMHAMNSMTHMQSMHTMRSMCSMHSMSMTGIAIHDFNVFYAFYDEHGGYVILKFYGIKKHSLIH